MSLAKALQEYPQWLCWRKENREGKTTKIPYRADGKGRASATDAKTWCNHAEALRAFEAGGYDGIGFVFTANDPFTGIDLDHCKNGNGIEPWAKEIVDLQDSYTEITPSGTGLHIIIKGKMPGNRNRTGNIEFYDHARYFTFTGNHLEGTPEDIQERQQELNELHARIFPPEPGREPAPVRNLDISDRELIEKAKSAANGAAFVRLWNGDTSEHGGDDSAADMALCSHLAFWTGNDAAKIDTLFRQSGLYRQKWERKDYRERTISKACDSNNTCIYIRTAQNNTEAKQHKNSTGNSTVTSDETAQPLSQTIKDWIKDSSGWFETQELDRDLNILNAKDKHNRHEVLRRLAVEGLAEQHKTKNRLWRYVNSKVTHLNFKSANTEGALPIVWPFSLERLVNLFPGNMAVVAGAPNAGKTAFLLKIIKENQDQFPIKYFCSEMGDIELRSRLECFEGMDINDWNFDAIERATNFPDVIVPDVINIIDYVEMTSEMWQINQILTDISHKLGTGIAIVAIQKKEGAKYGRGQEFGLEKPKIYLSMDAGKIQIIKGKSWTNKKVNPNGLELKFAVKNGCEFITGHEGWNRDGSTVLDLKESKKTEAKVSHAQHNLQF